MRAMADVPKEVSRYMSEMGIKGGRIGGKASGKRKARSPEHYRKMVEARNGQRKRAREETGLPADYQPKA
jgi:hypothetical protein